MNNPSCSIPISICTCNKDFAIPSSSIWSHCFTNLYNIAAKIQIQFVFSVFRLAILSSSNSFICD